MEAWIAVIAIGGGATACLLGHWVAFRQPRNEQLEGDQQDREGAAAILTTSRTDMLGTD